MTVATDYIFDASENKITLGAGSAIITIEQILSIRNITKNIEIYNSGNSRKHGRLFADDPADRVGLDIGLAVGVITFFEKTAMDYTDKIQILF